MKILILTFVLLIGCDQSQNKENTFKSSQQRYNCVLNVNIEFADSMILNNAKLFNKTYSQNDSCYLIFLDNLLKRSCEIKSQENLILIDSLYKISDGYVAEYFADTIGVSLFENCFESLLEFVSRNNQTSLLNLLIHSLDYNIDISKRYDKQSIINKLNYYSKNESNVEYRKIISSIVKKLK